MKFAPLLFAALMSGCAAEATSPPAPKAAASAAQPAVIELYQSQGCSSCPPALAVFDELAKRPDVIALNFAVTYWDQLGWKDEFAKPEFTARQWDFARAGGRGNVQTPQLIVNGRAAVLGSRKAEVEAAILANARAPGPKLAISGDALTIGAGKRANATVWVVDYDPRRIAVPIRAGENGGRTLVHTDVVRRLTSLGAWTGASARYSLPAATSGLKRAVLVQDGKGGPIIAAERI
jgi:hypothetical protein